MEEDYVMIPGSGTKMIIRDVKKEIETAFLDYSMSVIVARAQRSRQPEPAQERVGGRFGREKAQLPLPGPRHRLSSRKCQSRMLPAMPAFRLSTRSVMGMRTVPVQAAMVSSVRP